MPGHERLPGVLGGGPASVGAHTPLLIWPKILLFHATACLLTLWDDLGTDPRRLRLVREEFLFERAPLFDEELIGAPAIEEIEQQAGQGGAVDDRIDLAVGFDDMDGLKVALYRASYCLPIATPGRPRA
jgi:hypothetical protein